MLLPSVFNDNVFDDLMNDFDDVFTARNPLYGKHTRNMMKTDVRDVGDHYELDIDLPGFKKDEIHAQLENGYLTISASKGVDKDEKDKKGQYIRRERTFGQCARSFYVGEGVTEADERDPGTEHSQEGTPEGGQQEIHRYRRITREGDSERSRSSQVKKDCCFGGGPFSWRSNRLSSRILTC